MLRSNVRVMTPDTGGGFGTKVNVYPEEVLIGWISRHLRRPVKWVETRSEHMLSATQERVQIHDIEMGFDDDGRLLGYKDLFLHDMGAYAPRGGAVPINTVSCITGPYFIPAFRFEFKAVYTNMVTVSAYRGAGQPQGVFVTERIMDRIAQYLGKDPAEVRKSNFIAPDMLPYNTGISNLTGGFVEYDSGDFRAIFDGALEVASYDSWRKMQKEARSQGRLLGIGMAYYVELTGRGPWEGGGVRMEPDGRVTVYSGAPSQGQGHATTFAQIVADELGIKFERVQVVQGDTAAIKHGIGTFASRVGVLVGNAVRSAAIDVGDKLLRVAAEQMQIHRDDLMIEDGRVVRKDSPNQFVSFEEVVRRANRGLNPDEDPGIESVHYFKAPKNTYASGSHLALVEVNPQTGEVEILDYVVSHDCGRMINPMVVEGQIIGGLACGIGNALLEEHAYNEDGQLVTGSFMDYAMPRARNMPSVRMVHLEFKTERNPLSVKGIGEAGTIPAAAAIAGAVEDALLPLGVRVSEHPLTPQRVWRLVARADGSGRLPTQDAA